MDSDRSRYPSSRLFGLNLPEFVRRINRGVAHSCCYHGRIREAIVQLLRNVFLRWSYNGRTTCAARSALETVLRRFDDVEFVVCHISCLSPAG